jgi:hypothetical protein
MEDDLNLLANGRRPQFLEKWKTTSIFWEMEKDPIFWGNLEDDINLKVNGR